ncbi:MAG: hypothetical protein NTZ51_08350 [Proteobacteria bacterium]|nr:hypothetical protein [Pseudomonadota bacterium]
MKPQRTQRKTQCSPKECPLKSGTGGNQEFRSLNFLNLKISPNPSLKKRGTSIPPFLKEGLGGFKEIKSGEDTEGGQKNFC